MDKSNERRAILDSWSIEQGAVASDIANLRTLVTMLEDKLRNEVALRVEFEVWLKETIDCEWDTHVKAYIQVIATQYNELKAQHLGK